MKPKKSAKGVSNCPFLFLEKKHQRKKFESAYSDKPQLAISGTSHTVTTPNGRVIHKKLISKPIADFYQEPNSRGISPRGPDGRFIRSPSKQKRSMMIESEDESETPLMDIPSPKTPEAPNITARKKSTFRRGRPKHNRDRATPNSPQTSPDINLTPGNNLGPLTNTATNTTDTEVDRAIEDAKSADQDVFMRDENGNVITDISQTRTHLKITWKTLN